MPRRGLVGAAMVAVAAASWGTWSLFLYPTHLPARVTTPIMFLAMGLAALPLPRLLREPPATWDREALRLLAANTICDAVNVIAFFAAMDVTTVAVAVIAHYAAPIVIALAAPWLDRSGPPARGARIAAVAALGGLAIVLEPWHAPAAGAVLGVALGLVSAVAYAGNVFAVKRLAAKVGAARAIAAHSLIGGALMLPLVFVRLGPRADDLSVGAVARVAAGAVVIGTLANVLFIGGLARIGAARTAVLTFAEPLVAVLVGALCWHQRVHPIAAVGGAVVLAAGIHVARQAR